MTLLRTHRAALIVALLALAASVTSLGHDFTYDDRYVILSNDLVHHLDGLAALWRQTYWPARFGADGYRPVVMTLFTLEWVAGGGAAWVFHLVNILLAVATACAVRWCAAAVLPEAAAFVAGALFAVHPVHVEVTGNIVGQSELVVALCLALAVGLYLRRRLAGTLSRRDAASICALFTIALFTKEHAIVLPGLLAAAELTVLHDDDWRTRLRHVRPLVLTLVALTLGYVYVRGTVQVDLTGFHPFPIFRYLQLSATDRVLTMMSEVPRVARLLVFPAQLSGDYSPPDVVVANGFDLFQLPGITITLGVLVLAALIRRTAPVASFGLLWIVIAYLPVSNILVPAGFVTAERTLYFPSIGVVLIAGAVMCQLQRVGARAPATRFAYLAVALLLVAGTARSVFRQRVWKNNTVFFEQLVRDAPQGYRSHFVHGRDLAQRGDGRGMELEFRRAIRMFPYDAIMTLTIADTYARSGLYKPAVDLFEWTYAVDPETGEDRYLYVYCLAQLHRWADVRAQAVAGISRVHPVDVKRMHAALVAANSALHDTAARNGGTLAIRKVSATSH